MDLIITKNIQENKPDFILCPVFEENTKIERLFAYYENQRLAALLNQAKKSKFIGKSGQILHWHSDDYIVVFIGLGKSRKLQLEDWREAAGQVINFLKNYNVKNLAFILNQWLTANQSIENLAQGLAEGFVLASYNFDKYKKIDKHDRKKSIQSIIVELASDKKQKFISAWQRGVILAQGTMLARDLVNEPANIMTPTFLAETAKGIAKNNPNVRVRILEKEQVVKMGLGAFVGVDLGSSEPLKFIHLTYKPKAASKEKIALVGKGLTFDSGGLNIKTGDSMSQMKIDMAGAAAVLGIFSVIDSLKIKKEVHGIIAACENMPSGQALRPGDILRSMSGKSIEIGNTDAEGRLTLADAITYAQKIGATKIIDIATLTGAVMVALGPSIAGLFANDEALAKEISEASKNSGEKMWRLPLEATYKDFMKSTVADIRNIPNTRYGGAITAALFLQEFVNSGTAWVHMDIAAPAYAEKPLNSYTAIGGVGFGVRTILEWLKN